MASISHADKSTEALLLASLVTPNENNVIDSGIDNVLEGNDTKSTPAQTENLTSAFEMFNDLSQQLTGSYQLLEERVTKLTSELEEVSEQRLNESSWWDSGFRSSGYYCGY